MVFLSRILIYGIAGHCMTFTIQHKNRYCFTTVCFILLFMNSQTKIVLHDTHLKLFGDIRVRENNHSKQKWQDIPCCSNFTISDPE